jgi:hypothetical protein
MENEKINEEYPLFKAEPEEMPEPTIWPFAMAFGLLFIFWGFLTSYVLSLAGLIIIGFALAGWIQTLLHE